MINYACQIQFDVKIDKGEPVIKDIEDAYRNLFIVSDMWWVDEVLEPEYDDFLLWITETKEFKELKEDGLYHAFQYGNLESETSTDWESGIEEIDGWIVSEEVTRIKKMKI